MAIVDDDVDPILSDKSAAANRPRSRDFHAGQKRLILAVTDPLQVLLMTFSGLVNRHHVDIIAYLVEENRVLKE